MTPKCRVCGAELTEENWYPSHRKKNSLLCKGCDHERVRLWKEANPEKVKATASAWKEKNPGRRKAIWTRHSRKQGHQPFNENKRCGLYFGVHIAERVLSHVFKNIERMPMNNPGYDMICNTDKKIDIKSSCTRKRDGNWSFGINHNTIADYFLCLAFDNREDLNPLHIWLIPGSKINHLTIATINPSTIHKWDEYRLNISKISDCCDAMR